MNEELKKLFEGADGLQPDFLTKVSAIVESKVTEARTQAIKETEAVLATEKLELLETHKVALVDMRDTTIAEMTEKLDGFLNGVVAEWANNNAPTIDAKIRTEAAQGLLEGVVRLVKESGLNVPTESEEIISNLSHRVEMAEFESRRSNEELRSLRESANKQVRESIIASVCEGLADTQKETVTNLCEGVPMVDADSFKGRVVTFRGLVEGKKTKKEGDDDNDDDDDDGKDKDGKDKQPKKEGDDKDDAGDELTEAIKRQAAAARARLNG